MNEFDTEARDEGHCGYIGDGRDEPCRLVEGWGYENTSSGFCRKHGDRGGTEGNQNAVGNDGGAPEQNDNAVTHGAYRKHFTSHITDGEQDAFGDAREQLETPEGAQDVARVAATNCLLQFQRSGDERFLRRFEGLCDKFGIAPADELDVNHSGIEEIFMDDLRGYHQGESGDE